MSVAQRLSSCRRASLLTLALVFPLTAVAAEVVLSAQELFNRMKEAVRDQSYDGVLVYQRGQAIDSMRILHRYNEGTEQERLISLSGPQHEVIRNNDTVSCYFPETKSVMVQKNHPPSLFPGWVHNAGETSRFYHFVTLGRDRVANRDATVIGIQPRSAFRYGYRLWIDDATHLLLKSDVVNSHGSALEQIFFTQLSAPADIQDNDLEPAIQSQDYQRLEDGNELAAGPQEAAAQTHWQARWLPEGFTLREHQVKAMPAHQMPVENLTYSDGIAVISVFVEKTDQSQEPLQGFSTVGAISTYSMLVGEQQITAVGEVPPLTVRQIASSMAPAH
jgi:sigma-E factor negative regulatory protein RseB